MWKRSADNCRVTLFQSVQCYEGTLLQHTNGLVEITGILTGLGVFWHFYCVSGLAEFGAIHPKITYGFKRRRK